MIADDGYGACCSPSAITIIKLLKFSFIYQDFHFSPPARARPRYACRSLAAPGRLPPRSARQGGWPGRFYGFQRWTLLSLSALGRSSVRSRRRFRIAECLPVSYSFISLFITLHFSRVIGKAALARSSSRASHHAGTQRGTRNETFTGGRSLRSPSAFPRLSAP